MFASFTRATFRNRPEKREFVEAFFEMCRNFPFTLFAIVMERPLTPPTGTGVWYGLYFMSERMHHVLEPLEEGNEEEANSGAMNETEERSF